MNIICYQIIAIQEVLALDLEVASLAEYQVGVKWKSQDLKILPRI